MIYEALRRFACLAAFLVAFAIAFPSLAQQGAKPRPAGQAQPAKPAPPKDPFATDVLVPVAQPQPAAASAAPAPAPQLFAAPQAESGKTDAEGLEALKSRLASEQKALADFDSQIVSQTAKIQDMLDNYNRAEKNLTGFNGLGRVEQMELKAELYAGERLARKRIGDEFSALSKAVSQWESLKRKIKEDQGLLALRKQISDLKNGTSSGQSGALYAPSSPKSISEIEYYQVLKDADLRTISSYPDVYGSSDLWEHLFKANKDKLQDPNKIVPKGTTLVVPQDAKKLPDFSDL